MQARQESFDSFTFNHSMRIEVSRPPFKLLGTLARLDFDALAKARHEEIEVGYFETGCRQFVRAVVEYGMVTDVVMDSCPDGADLAASDDLLPILEAAKRRMFRGRKRREFKPTPVREFSRSLAQTGITTITCIQICFLGVCFVCCETVRGDWHCGDRVVIVRD